jgi:hypothetical protein
VALPSLYILHVFSSSCRIHGLQWPGADYKDFELPTPNPELRKIICLNDLLCMAEDVLTHALLAEKRRTAIDSESFLRLRRQVDGNAVGRGR